MATAVATRALAAMAVTEAMVDQAMGVWAPATEEGTGVVKWEVASWVVLEEGEAWGAVWG